MAKDVALLEPIASSSRIATAAGAAAPPDTLPSTFMSAKLAILATVTAESFIESVSRPLTLKSVPTKSKPVPAVYVVSIAEPLKYKAPPTL